MKNPAVSEIFLAACVFLVCRVTSQALEPASFDFMGLACCFGANEKEDPESFGGYGRGGNFPRGMEASESAGREGVYIKVIGQSKTPFADRFKGLEIHLVNNGRERLVLPASDSRIHLFQEALDASGQWKAVEFFPSSWCGNSYHNVYLEPGYYFSFVVPKYSGPMKTKLRFKLESSSASPVVSEEFEGGIHLEQFGRGERGRSRGARSIMDPTME